MMMISVNGTNQYTRRISHRQKTIVWLGADAISHSFCLFAEPLLLWILMVVVVMSVVAVFRW